MDGGRCAGVGLRQGAARCSCLALAQAACHSMEMLLPTCCCSSHLPALRVESIMVSAPPLIAWKYNVQPEAGSQEERLVQLLQQPREWV